jgi:hypothetical protein
LRAPIIAVSVACVLPTLWACSTVLGITDLVDPGGPDAQVDAAAEAAVPDDAGVKRCAIPGATFCADFDHGATPGAEFDGVELSGGGSLALIDATSTSAPKCVRMILPDISSSVPGRAAARLARGFSLTGKKGVSLQLAMRVHDGTPQADEILQHFAILIDDGSIGLFRSKQRWFVAIHRHNVAADADEEYGLGRDLPLGSWIHVDLDIVFGRSPAVGQVRLGVDGNGWFSQATETHGDAQPLDAGVLVVGPARGAGAVAATTVDFDDIVLRLSE